MAEVCCVSEDVAICVPSNAEDLRTDAVVEPCLNMPMQDLSRCKLIDLFREFRLLMAQRQHIDYRLMCILRELDRRDGLDGQPIRLASWLTRELGFGYGAASEKVRVARALGELPVIDAAYREGKLSYAKVRALTRVANADNERELLHEACAHNADVLEHIVRRYRKQERIEDVQEMIRQRSLTYRWDDDGALVVRGRLTPEQGAILIRAIEKAERELGSDESYGARHADALTHALEDSLSDDPGSGSTADHYQVVVHVPAETFAVEAPGSETEVEFSAGTPTETPSINSADGFTAVNSALPTSSRTAPVPLIERGPPLHPESIRRLTCDGALISVLEDGAGNVLNVGRKTRTIPPALRRALKVRDKHCQYPGCGSVKYVEGHHIVHWSRGGETSLSNTVLLCRRHHRVVHEFGLSVRRENGAWRFGG